MTRLLLLAAFAAVGTAAAQTPDTLSTAPHAGHAAGHHATPPDTTDHAAMGHGISGHAAHSQGGSATVVGAQMSRDGSGTAWLPDAGPMEMAHAALGGWSLGLHGAVFPRVTAQDAFGAGERGETAVGAPNWAMGMAQRAVGHARLTLRLMASLDDVVEGGAGYPLLFQSGETFEGERLVDRQHPHDVISEASATLSAPLTTVVGAFAYVAYPGEPALGPPAFMHRPSARFQADAPLSHHWQDATHIAWGVVTGGVTAGPVKLDASVFSGAEPDEDRYTPDAPSLDSYSARISFNPTSAWAFQVSGAFLREPEAVEPGVDQTRLTASALWSRAVGDGDVSTALVWGMNSPSEHADDHTKRAEGHGPTHSLLAEGALRRGRTAVFGRAEAVQKAGEELSLAGALGEDTHVLGTLTLGAGREVARVGGVAVMVGGQASAYAVPSTLRPLYGDAPISLQAFLRFAPATR